jgi:tetratricopeptide (TPR) repeat protein
VDVVTAKKPKKTKIKEVQQNTKLDISDSQKIGVVVKTQDIVAAPKVEPEVNVAETTYKPYKVPWSVEPDDSEESAADSMPEVEEKDGCATVAKATPEVEQVTVFTTVEEISPEVKPEVEAVFVAEPVSNVEQVTVFTTVAELESEANEAVFTAEPVSNVEQVTVFSTVAELESEVKSEVLEVIAAKPKVEQKVEGKIVTETVPEVEPEVEDTTVVEPVSDSTASSELTQDFIAFYNKHRSAGHALEPAELTELAMACCSILMNEPFELGTEIPPSGSREKDLEVLQKQANATLPEVEACLIWINCLDNQIAADTVENLIKLVNLPHWEPIQLLVCRSLAWLGERRALADLIPAEGDLSDVHLEILTSGEFCLSDEAKILSRIPAELEGDVTDSEIITSYRRRLLKAEMSIACEETSASHIKELESLVELSGDYPFANYIDMIKTQIGIRAEAALLRLRIGDTECSDIVISDKLDTFLPLWEKHYYQALIHWKNQKLDLAETEFEEAYKHNHRQGPLRYACASVLANQAPEKALNIIGDEQLTYEATIVRGKILVRLKRYDEARTLLLDINHQDAIRESLRFRWFGAEKQMQQQMYMVQTALAEYEGNWDAALRFWRKAFIGNTRDKLYLARLLYISAQLHESIPAGKRRKLAQVELDIKRIQHSMKDLNLAGDELFFQTAAEVRMATPGASKKMNYLRCRKSWTSKEKEAGSERLMFIAKELLQDGYVEDAVSAYERSGINNQNVNNILAILSVYSGIVDKSNDHILSIVLGALSKENTDVPLFNILAAMGLILSGEKEDALSYIEQVKPGTEYENVCLVLRSLCAPDENISMDREVLKSLDVPEEVRAVFNALTEESQLEAYINKYGRKWTEHYPLSPTLAIRQTLATLIQENKLEETDNFISELKKTGHKLPIDLKSVVCLRHVLDRVMKKELISAEKLLKKLEAVQ